jgi:ATP-dependent helicase/nuclease subunit A
MELLDFASLPDASGGSLDDWLTAELDRYLAAGRLTKEEKEAAEMKQISAFCRTSLAARMAAAAKNGTLYKEQPFVIGIAADRLDPDFPSEEVVMIQGVIDSFFAEGENLVVVDYKSDKVKKGEELVELYQKQLDYYQEALEQLTEKKVTEKLIYSFTLGEVIAL